MCRKFGFCSNGVANEDKTCHCCNAATQGTHHLHLENERVTRHHFTTELHVVNLQEISAPPFGFLHVVEHQKATCLCHRLHNEHTRHDGFLWEVSREERLVAGHVLHCHNLRLIYCYHLVNQLHRVAVRQQVANLVHVHQRLLIGVVGGALHLVLLDVLLYCARELIIYSMSRLRGNHSAKNGLAHQGEVTDDVEQFVTCRLVVPREGLVVDVAQTGGIHVRDAERVGQFVVAFLWQLALIDDDGVVEVAALDESQIEQGLNLSHKHEGARRGDFCWEIFDIVEIGKLVVQYLRVESNLGIHAEVVIGQQNEVFTILALDFHLVLHHIVVFLGFLLLQTHLLYLLHEG